MTSTATTGERVTVVGAGVIGIACAHYLSAAGFAVTVIDRGAVGGACSAANCGYICPSHVLPLTEPGAIGAAIRSVFTPDAAFRVRPQADPAVWNWFWQFARRCTHRQMLRAGAHLKAILDSSMAEYRRVVAAEALDCEWRETGLLYVLQTERGMAQFAHTDALLRKHFGVGARRVEGAALPALDAALRPGLAGAFHYPGDASVRPDLLNARWAARLAARDVTFIEHCALREVTKAGGRVTGLVTSRGEVAADRVVFATGAWSGRLAAALECRIPVQPGKGYSVTTARPDPCPSYPMLFPEHRVGVSPFAGGYRLGSIMEFAGFDESIPARRIAQLRDAATHYLVSPYPAGNVAERTWYGWRPMTWDSLPIIGRVPRLSNAYLATGHNMLGMSLATATGRLIAEIVQGRATHIDAAAFSPGRFGG